MNLFVVFWNRFNIRIPSIFSAHFLYTRLRDLEVLFGAALWRVSSESWVWLRSINWTVRRWSGDLLPLGGWSSQEWNSVGKLLSLNVLPVHFILVRDITVKDERCGVKWGLEGALGWSHGWTVFRTVLYTHGLDSFSCNWFFWGILSKEFWICHSRIIKCYMVVHWAIEVFSISCMSRVIILWALDIKIRDPA